MTELDLTNQLAEKTDIGPKLIKLTALMDQRKPIWDKLPLEKKKKWVLSDKDPIMGIAWDVYKYLRNNFFMEQDND